jgi:hypothetical protein
MRENVSNDSNTTAADVQMNRHQNHPLSNAPDIQRSSGLSMIYENMLIRQGPGFENAPA